MLLHATLRAEVYDMLDFTLKNMSHHVDSDMVPHLTNDEVSMMLSKARDIVDPNFNDEGYEPERWSYLQGYMAALNEVREGGDLSALYERAKDEFDEFGC